MWAATRPAPLLLKVLLLAFVLLLLASVLCIFLGVRSSGDALYGAFGAAAAVLGFALVFDLSGSATAMEQIDGAIRSGPMRIPGGRWTARRYRMFGGAYVLLGVLFAVVGWSGVATGKR